ncbi:hypothetical protein [Thiorhodovibrio frisius]|uniref:Uncharacterized protein n=1 Tax=Thiorhodovibrio frisius TaxID=631362 RepID=H8YVZ4_9GAMM|nr:hypothetical protein [Thiorhodovibrio frisius]EIC23785.1 hypothetical protein Thi970DRAFT_00296 [Thiorhodovibrio frisius]WPL23206.1 hypothetical protein Thiofri_03389 [Thiorhodovibrio frisius]
MNLSAPAHLETREAVTLEAIYTFTDGPQRIEHLPFIGLASEANALFAVLSRLSESERQALLKVSLCLYCNAPDESEWLWLDESRGKYYFTATTPEPEAKPAPRIHPSLVAAFKADPCDETAQEIFLAVDPSTGFVVLDGATLQDGPSDGLVIRDCNGRFVVYIDTDGRLHASKTEVPA